MPTRKITPKEIEKMKRMVIQGVYPEDIARRFNMAVSSIHNYKKRFKEEGLEFPSLRGKRQIFYQSLQQPEKPHQRDETQMELNFHNPDNYTFVINTVEIEVSKDARHVNIDKDKMEILF